MKTLLSIICFCLVYLCVYLAREIQTASSVKNIGNVGKVEVNNKRYFLISVAYNNGEVLRSWGLQTDKCPTRKSIEEYIENDGGEKVSVTGLYEFKNKEEYLDYFK